MEGDVADLPDVTSPPRARPAGDAAGRPAEGTAATAGTAASHAVTALYRSHALALSRLAFLMLGDRQAAEDVVQEAFCSLFRAWDRLPDHANVLGYLRVSVVNGCRSVLRRSRRAPRAPAAPPAPSAEADVLVGEEKREAVAALRRLPPRQREALVLRPGPRCRGSPRATRNCRTRCAPGARWSGNRAPPACSGHPSCVGQDRHGLATRVCGG